MLNASVIDFVVLKQTYFCFEFFYTYLVMTSITVLFPLPPIHNRSLSVLDWFQTYTIGIVADSNFYACP